MTIQTGDRIPAATFKRMTANRIDDMGAGALFRGRKVAVFGLPGSAGRHSMLVDDGEVRKVEVE